MGHNLLNNTMAFVGEEPWHDLGRPVSPNVSAAEMCGQAGLDWKVEKLPAPGARVVDQKKEIYDRYLIYRDPIGEEQAKVALGMVGSGYEPLQNREAFAFFTPFIDTGFAQFQTAGALGNGERVWVQAKLQEQILVAKNDVIDRYLLLSNSHNGAGAVSIRFTPIRVVCSAPALDRLPPAKRRYPAPKPFRRQSPDVRRPSKRQKSLSAINRKPESDRLLVHR